MSFGSPGGPGIERMVMPEYPREARRLGKEGIVLLKLHLDAEGVVESVEVLETPGYGLDEAAREAVLRSRFHPATVGGVPVACRAILPVNFRLR
jgi:protein TonB